MEQSELLTIVVRCLEQANIPIFYHRLNGVNGLWGTPI